MSKRGFLVLFYPVILLMKKLKYTQKFALIGCSILALVAGIIYLFMSNLQPQIDFNAKENLGVEYIIPVKDFLAEVEQHRYMTDLYLKGNTSVKPEITQIEKQTQSIILDINKVDTKLNSVLAVEKKLQNIEKKWADLNNNYKKYSVKENFELHNQLINDTIAFISHLTDKSNLTLDPDLDTFYIMDAFGFKLPNLLEKISLAKVEGLKIISTETADNTELIKLSTLIDEINELLLGGKDVIYATNSSLKDKVDPYFNSAYNSNKNLLNNMDKLITNTGVVSKSNYISINDEAFNNNKKLYDEYSKHLYNLIAIRVKKYTDQIPVAIFFTLLISSIIGYLFVGFYLCLIDSVKKIESAAKKVEDGDLTIKINLDSKDELADLANIINHIFENLNKIVSNLFVTSKEIQNSSIITCEAAENTLQGAEQTTLSTAQLAQGTQEISRNVEEGASNINKMNKVIQGIFSEAKVAAELGNSTETNANEGAEHVKKAVNKIDSIKKVSHDISVNISELGQLSSEIEEIVDLIKNIAGQTNLLALNAAIEAARAGEHGKGFAVVADEVKKLAGQSAGATEKITAMIKEIQNKTNIAVLTMGKATNEVDEGVFVINDAGTALDNIIKQVKAANENIQKITFEIDGVARNSEDMVKMIENISAITEETAAGTEEISSISSQQNTNIGEITANAQSLAQIAENLNKQFSVYKV